MGYLQIGHTWFAMRCWTRWGILVHRNLGDIRSSSRINDWWYTDHYRHHRHSYILRKLVGKRKPRRGNETHPKEHNWERKLRKATNFTPATANEAREAYTPNTTSQARAPPSGISSPQFFSSSQVDSPVQVWESSFSESSWWFFTVDIFCQEPERSGLRPSRRNLDISTVKDKVQSECWCRAVTPEIWHWRNFFESEQSNEIEPEQLREVAIYILDVDLIR